MKELFRRLRALLHRGCLDRELAVEMESHFEMLAEEVGNGAASNLSRLLTRSRNSYALRTLSAARAVSPMLL